MPAVPENVEWFLRASRDLAACIGRLQNPVSTEYDRGVVDSKARATIYVLRDAALDMPGDFTVLEEGLPDARDLEHDRSTLLAKAYSPSVRHALQHAGRVRTVAPVGPLSDLTHSQSESWRSTAKGLHGSERGYHLAAIRDLRVRREAFVTGIALTAVASATVGTERDALLRLAKATLELKRS